MTSYSGPITADANEFIELNDCPSSYSGEANKVVRVNAGETGLEFATVSGSGDVVGPGASTDNAVVRFNGAGGTSIQNSAVIVDDSNNITGVTSVTVGTAGLHLLDTDASHDLVVTVGSNLSADRAFTLTTGDAARTLDISAGNVTISTAGAALIDDADAGTQRVTLGLGSIATQAANNVSISGGSITGITDLVVADGGTGVSTLTSNGVLLGNGASAIQAMTALTDGLIITGISSAAPAGLPTMYHGQTLNLAILPGTTTNANDSLTFTGSTAALSSTNPAFICINSTATAGRRVIFKLTANVTLLLTGAHWGQGGKGDLTGAILRTYAINDNGSLRLGVSYSGGKDYATNLDTNATPTSVTASNTILVNSAVSAGTWPCVEFGYFYANFDDTGGAAEDLWSVSTATTDLFVGTLANNIWQTFNTAVTGFSSDPTWTSLVFRMAGKTVTVQADKNAAGTSNATTFTFELPIKAARVQGGFLYEVVNNGALTTGGGGSMQTRSNSAVADLYLDFKLAASWTAANGKSASFFITYEAQV